MKKMLINATQPEEIRVALVDGQELFDLDIELAAQQQRKGNVYKGRVMRVEVALEAAFVDYGEERHGFLPFKEVSLEQRTASNGDEHDPALHEGQELLLQVDKEARDNKGASLTTFISLAGRYLVLVPNNPRVGGISRQIPPNERDQARQALSELDVPEGMGLILRTAGVGHSVADLGRDLEHLLSLWASIREAAQKHSSPFLVYKEIDGAIRAIRDYLTEEVREVLIDNESLYQQAREYIERTMPEFLERVKIYTDPEPIFIRHQIESQIETAYSRQLPLPSGGSLVIDHTEALICVDINSARATGGGDIEETALNTNLEAAQELARQLRIRDLGGLIVIDFIDMSGQKDQEQVEQRLRECTAADRARVQFGRISRFGLLEMSRQRLRPSLRESSHETCPRCDGIGQVRTLESQAMAMLRIIEEAALKSLTVKVLARLPVDVCAFLVNEKKHTLHALEQHTGVQIIVMPIPEMEIPHYEIERLRRRGEADEESAGKYERPGLASRAQHLKTLENKMLEEPAAGVAPAVRNLATPGGDKWPSRTTARTVQRHDAGPAPVGLLRRLLNYVQQTGDARQRVSRRTPSSRALATPQTWPREYRGQPNEQPRRRRGSRGSKRGDQRRGRGQGPAANNGSQTRQGNRRASSEGRRRYSRRGRTRQSAESATASGSNGKRESPSE